jgi:putative endonuclease
LQRKEGENNQPMKATEETKVWYVYMVRCRDNTLYTGITTDIHRRLEEHNSTDSITRYTRSRQPVKIVYYEQVANRSEAGKREYRIKKLHRQKKELLISTASLCLKDIDVKQ